MNTELGGKGISFVLLGSSVEVKLILKGALNANQSIPEARDEEELDILLQGKQYLNII